MEELGADAIEDEDEDHAADAVPDDDIQVGAGDIDDQPGVEVLVEFFWGEKKEVRWEAEGGAIREKLLLSSLPSPCPTPPPHIPTDQDSISEMYSYSN